jgi:uncharacterized membrane protein
VSRLSTLVTLLAVVGLGLTAGALLAEAMVLVPFWQSLDPAAFFDWYRANARLLFEFFAPLEIGAAVLIVVAAVVNGIQRGHGTGFLVVAALLAVAILVAFPLYFKEANASFANASIPAGEVGAALRRWATWHAGRTVAALGAFVCAAIGFSQT